VVFELGSSLREARQRRGLELDEVADQIMIRVRYLGAIEDERFHLLPHGSYRRSFLREYAEFLGLDGDIYVDEYIARHEAADPEPALLPPRPRAPLGVPAAVNVVLVLAVAAVLGAVVWGLGGSEPKRSALPEPAPPPAQRVIRSKPAPRAPSVTPQRARPSSLTFTATRGRCWLSVHLGSLSGPTVYERTLEQGQTVRFGLRRPLWIRLGAPQNLDAAVGRNPVANLPTRVATVAVTARGVAVQ
jgi:cytoskeleton protein RodZ